MFVCIKNDAMRTTLDIPEDLMKQAMKIAGNKTKSQVIREALSEMIERRKRMRLLAYKGKVDLDIDMDALRDRK